MNKVLSTGGCGFIGFHMIKRLIKNNYKVLNIDFTVPVLPKKVTVELLFSVKKNLYHIFME